MRGAAFSLAELINVVMPCSGPLLTMRSSKSRPCSNSPPSSRLRSSGPTSLTTSTMCAALGRAGRGRRGARARRRAASSTRRIRSGSSVDATAPQAGSTSSALQPVERSGRAVDHVAVQPVGRNAIGCGDEQRCQCARTFRRPTADDQQVAVVRRVPPAGVLGVVVGQVAERERGTVGVGRAGAWRRDLLVGELGR